MWLNNKINFFIGIKGEGERETERERERERMYRNKTSILFVFTEKIYI